MNKKVAKTLISLCWLFLVGFALLKTVGADWFAAQVQNKNILLIGEYIDNHVWAIMLCDTIAGIIGGYFYNCACLQVWKLKPLQFIIIVFASIIGVALYRLDTIIGTIFNFAELVVLPLIFKAKWKQVTFIFIVHFLCQAAILYIRTIPLFLLETNYAIKFIILFDGYIWYALYYLYSNYYKEATLWEYLFSFFSAIKRKKASRENLQK